MLKTLPVALMSLLAIAGCVTVAPATNAPTSGASVLPTLGVTTPAPTGAASAAASATPAPTAVETVAPTIAPTLEPSIPATEAPSIEPSAPPSDVPSGEPTGEPTGEPSGEPGTRDMIFSDDMSDPASGWSTLEQDFVTIVYDSGVLAFRFNPNDAWSYSVRTVDDAQATLLTAGDFSPQSDGIFGALCGNSITGKLYGAVVATDGSLAFIDIVDNKVDVLKRHDDLGLDVTIGDSNPLALECAVDGLGGISMVVGMRNTGPVATYRTETDAPLFLDISGLYAEATSEGYTLAVDLAAAAGIAGAGGTMSEGASILLAHIPTDYQENCYESPQFSDAAEFKITCLPEPGDGPELERYEQFTDKTAMDAAYQDLVSTFGVDSTGSCQTGPNETTWSPTGSDTSGGRIQCAPQAVGIRFDWTDDLTSILSALVDFNGSYPKTYNSWIDAGPIIPQG